MKRHQGARRQFKGRKGKPRLLGFGVRVVGFSPEAQILLRRCEVYGIFLLLKLAS